MHLNENISMKHELENVSLHFYFITNGHFLNDTLKIFFEENRDIKNDFSENRKRIDLFLFFIII